MHGLQPAFGRVNDLDVSLRWLRRCPEAHALPGHAARRVRAREAARDAALFLWGEHASALTALR